MINDDDLKPPNSNFDTTQYIEIERERARARARLHVTHTHSLNLFI